MAKTSRDAWRHYGAIVDFFGVLEDLVSRDAWEEFVRAHKERKYLRQSFRRLVARGFIKEAGGKWKVTALGARFFGRTRRVSQRPASWDGKWRLVSFDVPVERNTMRDSLRALLVEFDFLPLQKSVWVSPFATEREFVELMEERGLWRYCKLMVVDILEGDQDLRRQFKLPVR